MSFQAYLDNIEEKTGRTPRQFIDAAASRGYGAGTKAGEIIAWLAEDYGLGRGHAAQDAPEEIECSQLWLPPRSVVGGILARRGMRKRGVLAVKMRT